MFLKLKEFFVKIGLVNKCPHCGSKILEEGYPSFVYQKIRCDGCGWGKTWMEKDKVVAVTEG